jgi:hypothetical protein
MGAPSSSCLVNFLSPFAMSLSLPDSPDPALPQPATLAALAPLILCFYAQAVLAILPNTFVLKLSLLPFVVWQAWSCAVTLSFSMGLANLFGMKNDERLRFWNPEFVVSGFLHLKEEQGFPVGTF